MKKDYFFIESQNCILKLILLHRQIEKGAFSKPISNTTEDILDLQDNLLLLFTYLGRIMNNIEEASALLDLKETETFGLLKEFYHKTTHFNTWQNVTYYI